jgi:hypothetical protein
MMPDPIRDAIRLRAYELFERRGREHGRDWQDRFEAEKAILANFQADTVLHYGPSGIVDAAGQTLRWLGDLGIAIPPGNRLQNAKALIERVNDGRVVLTDDDDLLNAVAEAMKKITEQYIIVRAMNPKLGPPRPEVAVKLRMMLSGAATADQDANPETRNTQFELYVAGILTLGGARVVVEEPDLGLEFGGQRVGIAAKHVRSLARVLPIVDEATDQIKRSERQGFVALNVDVLVKNTGAPSDNIRLGERLAALARVDEKVRTVPEALGTMVFGYDTCWTFGGEKPRVEVGNFTRFHLTAAGIEFHGDSQRFFAGVLDAIKRRLHRL